MKIRIALVAAVLALVLAGALIAERRGRGFDDFRGFGGSDEARVAITPLYQDEKTEWAFTRLAYQSGYGGGYGRRGGRWNTDGPKSDHQFVVGVQRLTRLHTFWDANPVPPSSDDIFEWPWLYAIEVGNWGFTEDEAEKVRNFLLRGGFMMIDDFHGEYQWEGFLYGMNQIFPDRTIEDIAETDEINHVVFDIKDRMQIANRRVGYGGSTYEGDGIVPHWRAIRDDRGRIMVAICHNMDVGDAWEWADDPRYPQPMALQAYQLGINYILYAMTQERESRLSGIAFPNKVNLHPYATLGSV